MDSLKYQQLLDRATEIRSNGRPVNAEPDERFQIPSRDEGRTIPAHIYNSKTAKTPSPVLINWHGSGFVMRMHGTDDKYARFIATETDYTVVDCAYRLGPEHPYPAAVHDVEDAIKWVLSQPEKYDSSRLSVSGFSAGANLALVASSAVFPKETFESVICFYPVTDLASPPETKSAPDASGSPIPDEMADFFTDCYVLPGVDRAVSTLSPTYTDAERFPDRLVMFTCAGDNLCIEAEELAEKVKKVEGKSVVIRRMDGCNHGWDKACEPGSPEEQLKNEAYELVKKTLQG